MVLCNQPTIPVGNEEVSPMQTASDFWILRPFNPLFWGVFAFFLAILAAAALILKNKSDRAKRITLCIACVLTLIGFFFYKYFLSIDAEFKVINADMGGFNWWGELPLQLCNINMLMIPVAVMTKKRPLLGFCFFVGTLGALMALMMPTTGFSGYSLLLPRMLGFFGTHFMIVIEALAIPVFGLYRPKYRDLPLIVLSLVGIAFVIFLIDMLLRWTGLHPHANYFFAVETEGNPVLGLFYKLLPYPFLYLLPCSLILGAYMAAVMLFFTAGDAIRARKARETQKA